MVQVLSGLRPAAVYRVGVAAFSDSGVSRAQTSIPTSVDSVRTRLTFTTAVVYSDTLEWARARGKEMAVPTFVFTPLGVVATGRVSVSRPGLYQLDVAWSQGVCNPKPFDSCLNASFAIVIAMPADPSATSFPLWEWVRATLNARSSVGTSQRLQWLVVNTTTGAASVIVPLEDACGAPMPPTQLGPMYLLPCQVTLWYPLG